MKENTSLQSKGMHIVAELEKQLATYGVATNQTVLNAVKPFHPSITKDFVGLILQFSVDGNLASFSDSDGCFYPAKSTPLAQDTSATPPPVTPPVAPKVYTVTLPNGLTVSGNADQMEELATKYPEYPLYHSETKDEVLVIQNMHTEHLMNSLVRDLNNIQAGTWTVTDLYSFFEDKVVQELIKRLA